jgi:hypothetical protein
VDHHAPGVPSGESWSKAFRTVGDALYESNINPSITEIWIADGTYPVTTDAKRDTAFIIEKGVHIYGGFAGSEHLLSERDPELYPVLLSGETGDTSTVADNVYHVILIQNTSDTTRIDGVGICCGNADGTGHTSGAGVYVSATNAGHVLLFNAAIMTHSVVMGNAVFNASNLILEQCSIVSDHTSSVIYNDGALARLTLKNTSVQQCNGCGEAIINLGGSVTTVTEEVEINKE